MPQTARGIVYPDSSGSTRIWEEMQTLGETTDAAIDTAVQQIPTGPPSASGTGQITLSNSANGSVTITFPANRFTAPPNVVASAYAGSSYIASVGATITATSAVIWIQHCAGTAVSAGRQVQWIARQEV